MNKLRIVAIVDKGGNLDSFKKYLSKTVLDVELIELESDFSDAPFIPSKGRMILSPEVLRQLGKKVFREYEFSVDFMMCFIRPENWEDGEKRIIGHHYGEVFSTYEASYTKLSGLWGRVAMHELMHKFDDLIFLQLGVRLENIFGVRDFDEDIVHARDPRYGREYDYNDTIEEIVPLIRQAVDSRRARGVKLNLLQELVQLYREMILLKRKTEDSIYNVPEKEVIEEPPRPESESRLVRWARAMKEHEGWCLPGGMMGGALYPKGSLSYRNNNPGNLRLSKYQAGQRNGYAYFDTYDVGWDALLFQLRLVAEGKSPAYNSAIRRNGWNLLDSSELSLLQFFEIYAPASDNNVPASYAQAVAGKIGVPVMTPVRDLLL